MKVAFSTIDGRYASGNLPIAERVCPTCNKSFKGRTKYCNGACYHAAPVTEETRALLSLAFKGKHKSAEHRSKIGLSQKGKAKPSLAGSKHPNFGGKTINRPDVRTRYLAAVKERGQSWTAADRAAHAERMLGPANAMRGRKHAPQTIARIATTKSQQYKDGLIPPHPNKISKPELRISSELLSLGVHFQPQFHIPDVPYWYDFYFPDLRLIVEFNGDYWHANPQRYAPDYLVTFPRGSRRKQAKDIWERDRAKQEAAESAGFQVLILWESTYKKEGLKAMLHLIGL